VLSLSQALRDILSGLYPCTKDDYVILISLQLLLRFGEYKDERANDLRYAWKKTQLYELHFCIAHYKFGNSENLSLYIPDPQKFSKKEQEQLIAEVIEQYAGLQQMTPHQIKLQFLQHCESWPSYGLAFYTLEVSSPKA
jgi:hypothetical protein